MFKIKNFQSKFIEKHQRVNSQMRYEYHIAIDELYLLHLLHIILQYNYNYSKTVSKDYSRHDKPEVG